MDNFAELQGAKGKTAGNVPGVCHRTAHRPCRFSCCKSTRKKHGWIKLPINSIYFHITFWGNEHPSTNDFGVKTVFYQAFDSRWFSWLGHLDSSGYHKLIANCEASWVILLVSRHKIWFWRCVGLRVRFANPRCRSTYLLVLHFISWLHVPRVYWSADACGKPGMFGQPKG